jgi:hypothetical protein
LVLQVQVAQDEDEEELTALTRRLRAQLLDLDVVSVDPLAETAETGGAKGLGAVIGCLAVQPGTADCLRSVVTAIAGWASRTSHDVEVSYGEDVLKVSGVTSAQQQRIIDDFLSRHAPRT